MADRSCCVNGFKWSGTPSGRLSKLTNLDVYIAGDNTDTAILFVTDILGWTLPNSRLLADHYAEEIGATVYVPDFFHGEVLPFEPINKGRFEEVDLEGFLARNAREIREPEIFECARELRTKYRKVGALGYCYGGWASFRLGAKEHNPPLVDSISVGHPSALTKEDIDGVAVPVQVLAPEFDQMYSAEMKTYTFETLQKNAVPFDYQHFPGVEHGCLARGDENKPGERDAMVRGKNALVSWMKQCLKDVK